MNKEFEAYLRCGILAHGFLQAHCTSCQREMLVTFNCKKRGFCPSCGARRMAETAAHLVDHVLPHKNNTSQPENQITESNHLIV